jgi:pSer/pThr/pTyr-binding forkhead associated (FHA) protein
MTSQQVLPQFHLMATDPRDLSVHDNGLLVVAVGRAAGCELPLEGRSVSELHACLVRRRDGVWLYDLGSRNGTSVNGRKAHAQRLNDGDNVQFGSHRYRIRISGQMGPAVTTLPASLHDSVAGRTELLTRPVTVVGRRERSDLCLSGDDISRIHCLLVRCGLGLIVHDLGSRNGTFVTGRREKELLLTGNEILMIGPYEFRVEVGTQEAVTGGEGGAAGDADDVWAAVAEETRLGTHPGDSSGPAAEPAGDDAVDFDALIADSLDESVPGSSAAEALDDLFADDQDNGAGKPPADERA